MALFIRLLSFCIATLIIFVLLASAFPALFPQFSFLFLFPLALATSFVFSKSVRYMFWVFSLLLGEMLSPLPFGSITILIAITIFLYDYIHEHYVTNQRTASLFFLALFMAFLFLLLFLSMTVGVSVTTALSLLFILVQQLLLFSLGFIAVLLIV